MPIGSGGAGQCRELIERDAEEHGSERARVGQITEVRLLDPHFYS